MADFAAFGAQALDSVPGPGGGSVGLDRALTLKPKSYFGYAEIQEPLQAYRNVIAIDFGTTYSGVAYSYANSGADEAYSYTNSDSDEILAPALWPREPIWHALAISTAHNRRYKPFYQRIGQETIEIFRAVIS